MSIYIIGSSAIIKKTESAQGIRDEILQSFSFTDEVQYVDFVPARHLRRMSSILKNSSASSQMALIDSGVEMPDGIIVGTGLGCLQDTENFLKNVWNSNEELLSPTNFIQSTHNTVAGQIALILGCTGYNTTYSNRGLSFEKALMDGKLLLSESGEKKILVGGADEHTASLEKALDDMGCSFEDNKLNEGSVFMLLSSTPNENSTEIAGFATADKLGKLERQFEEILSGSGISAENIDLVLTGGPDKDFESFHALIPKGISFFNFKPITGEFFTASSAGVFLANQILRKQIMPSADSPKPEKIKNVLVLNHCLNTDYSLYLLRI